MTYARYTHLTIPLEEIITREATHYFPVLVFDLACPYHRCLRRRAHPNARSTANQDAAADIHTSAHPHTHTQVLAHAYGDKYTRRHGHIHTQTDKHGQADEYTTSAHEHSQTGAADEYPRA